MNKLNELIQKLCPNGVEYKKLADCCVLEKGNTPIQKAIPGEFPLVVTTEERKSCNTYQFDKPTVCIPLVSSRGHGVASLNRLYYQEGKFALGNILCGVTPINSDELSAKFLFYYLNHKKDTLIVPLMRGGANVSLTVDSLKRVKVPVPPMSVQNEIVRALNKFEALAFELTAELTARKKQYEYYREKILSQTNNAEQCALQDIVADSCSISYGIVQTGDDVENGIPVVRPVDLADKIVSLRGLKRVAPSIAESYKRTILKGGDLLLCVRGTTGVISIASDELKGCNVSRGIVPLTFKSTVCPQYIYYQFLSQGIQKEIESKTRGTALKQINMEDLRQIRFPIPTLEVQQQIVGILDRFDALCNDITSGLPAEIEVRQKQFEYYRDKLLTFKQLS